LSQLQTNQSKCANCFHLEQNHHSGVCTGDLTCQCSKFEPPFLFEFAQRIEEEKHIRKSVYKRCEFILREIPGSRNAGEKSFAKIYKEIWYGFKIRKEGTKLTTEEWKRMPVDDLINREKRRVKHNFPELATYSKEVLWHQTAIYQALMEMAIET
jgi:hypothetical protein